ncbi:hypothetical protein QL983_01765 [Micrococcus sp. APC 4021]|nr:MULTISPECIES: hypothetical protein [Micrococcus]MCV7478600.1 hypothetical protein [Micrococcus luteus]MCV7488318.1 hypothetical protein [Micrococcus luteus]MDN3467471.1 hypothetical protein [Micrococcus sp. APC 4021]
MVTGGRAPEHSNGNSSVDQIDHHLQFISHGLRRVANLRDDDLALTAHVVQYREELRPVLDHAPPGRGLFEHPRADRIQRFVLNLRPASVTGSPDQADHLHRGLLVSVLKPA